MIGTPAALSPALNKTDLGPFWRQFDAAAPAHLRLAYWVATVWIAHVLPRLMGYWRPLHALSSEHADRIVIRASTLPVVASLTDLAKLVACFAYFSDDGVYDAVVGDSVGGSR
jgi:hypothetical protein